MKKQYITPAMQVQQITVCKVIATSLTGTNVEGLSYGGTTNGAITSGNAKSRDDMDDNTSNGWTDGLW